MFGSPKRRLLSALAAAGFLASAVAATLPALAQGTGLTLFSGVKREFLLPYSFDFDSGSGGRDRYRMRIPGNKMLYDASSITILYPAYYKGKFDLDRIEVLTKGDKDNPWAIEAIIPPELIIVGQPDDESKENDDFYRMEILLIETIPEGTSIEIVFSNVRNPRIGQTYYFNARVQPPQDVRERYVGTWIVDID